MSAAPSSATDTLRIALVASSYFPNVGGVESHVRAMASRLSRRGHAVEVWTVDREGGSHIAEVDGIRVRHLPAPLPASSASAVARFATHLPSAWRRWKRAAQEFSPDVIHVHCFGPNGVYALALHRALGTPLIITSHGETLGDDGGIYARSALLRASLRRAIARAAAVTAPSEYVLADLKGRFGLAEGAVVTNGVDTRELAFAPPQGDQPFLFAVGRLGSMKGFDLLIEAFRGADLGPDVLLTIGGDGPERQRLEALIDEWDLRDRVGLVGWMTSEEVAQHMAAAVAVVVPSRSEAFGIVALEAWRARGALIMTNRGGAKEFIRDGVDALLVDPTDIDELAVVIKRVATDEALREALRSAGSARVGDFDWARVADAYGLIYSSAPVADQVATARQTRA